MTRTNLEETQKSLLILEHEMARIRQQVRRIVPPGIEYSFEHGHLVFNTQYFDSHHDTWGQLTTSLAEKLAYEVKDYDHPTARSQGEDFCAFMGFSPKETELFLSVCSSDEAYDAWASEEMRSCAD